MAITYFIRGVGAALRLGASVLIFADIAAHSHIAIVPLHQLMQAADMVGIHIIVRVGKGDKFSSRRGKSGISGGGNAPIGSVKDGDPSVRNGQFIAELFCAVGRAVVHQNDLDVAVGLAQQGIHAPS